MITGSFQLTAEELEAKFGLMAQTTQCCASGTCDVTVRGCHVAADAGLPPIEYLPDGLDLNSLLAQVGAIV
jgi:hypothetical protein